MKTQFCPCAVFFLALGSSWTATARAGDPDSDIRARVFSPAIFLDGFEDGYTSAWSVVLGGCTDFQTIPLGAKQV